MRIAGYLLLVVGMVVLAVGLVSHFASHPDQLADPASILARAGVIIAVYAHPARHPSTMLALAAMMITAIGIVLVLVGQRSRVGR